MKKIICYLLLATLFLQTRTCAYGDQPFGFTGEDQDSNAVYLRERYYDPQTGTFLTKDPMGLTAGINQYTYVSNNPTNNIDPNGENPLLISGAVGAVIGGALGFGITYWKTGSLAKAGVAGLAGAGTGFLVGSGAFIVAGLVESIGIGGVVIGTGSVSGIGAASNNQLTQIGNGLVDGQTLSQSWDNVNYTEVGISGGIGFGLGAVGAPFSVASDAASTTAAQASSQVQPAVNNLNLLLNSTMGTILPDTFRQAAVESNQQIIQDALDTSTTAAAAKQTDFLNNALYAPTIQGLSDAILDGYFEPSGASEAQTSNLNVGGVLINQAAQLVGTNLSDIQGATFDPVSKQIVLLGSNTPIAGAALNMDYFYTAVEGVYGSAVPPYVSLDTPAYMYTPWSDYGNNDGIWESGEENGFILRYNPLWANQDTDIDVRIIASSTDNTQHYDFTLHFAVTASTNPPAVGGRQAMRLSYTGATGLPSGMTVDTSVLQGPVINLTSTSQDSYWTIAVANQTAYSISTPNVNVIPDRQHRRYGGRVDGTRLGWVMYQADRVMKCLAIGKDNLTGATYSSTSPLLSSVTGYKNLLERAEAAGTNGTFSRLWFEPDVMNLERYVDPTTGKATVVFQTSTVQLLTEAYLQGQPQDPLALAFANFFTANYDKFAAINFPVEDPVTGATISAPIFAQLKQAMQAVSIARFFRDNNIPLDLWWLNSYQPPTAYSALSTPTAYNSALSGSIQYVIFGGVQITTPNIYTPSSTAQSVGQLVIGDRQPDPNNPTQDIAQQAWPAGSYNAVAASFATDSQEGNINLSEQDLSFKSPGELPLQFVRYYQSSWLGTGNMGPGWRDTRYVLQFSTPSWFDQTHLMKDAAGNVIATDQNSDTRLRSGTVRLVDLATGSTLDFQSSLGLNYSNDAGGNAAVTITGLTSNDVPTFTAGQHQSGATMAQMTDGTLYYKITLPDTSSMEFDNNGNLLLATDRHGYKKWYAYNASGFLSTITDNSPTPQIITLTYNPTAPFELTGAYGPAAGNTAPNTDSTSYHYDTNTPPRLTSVVQNRSGATIAQYSYNSSNQLVDVTRLDGTKPVTTTADLKGRSLVRKSMRGNSYSFTFSPKDSSGARVTTAYDPNSGVGTWQHQADASGRSLYVKDPLNNYTMYGYTSASILPNSIQLPTVNRPAISILRNAVGLPTSINDPGIVGSQAMQIGYNSANLPNHVVDTAGRVVDAYYTGSNNLQIVRHYHNGQNIDSTLGYQSEFVHTAADPMNHTWTYGRDSVGRLTSVADPTGVTTSYDYDAYGHLWHIYDPTLSSPVVYSYDNLDRVSTVTTPSGTTTYTYSPTTQWLDHTTVATTDGQTQTVQYGYNNATGDVTSMTTTYQLPASSGGGTQSVTSSFGYSSYGALQTVTPPGAQPVNYNYNSLGQLLGTSETNSGLTTGPSIVASNATSGVWTNQNSQTFTWGAPTSSLPVTGYNFAKDASASMTVNTTGLTTPWSGVADGQHTFHVRAVDSGGNWSPESIFNLWVDTTAPAVSIVSVTPNPIPQGNVTVTVTANVSDAGSGLIGSPQMRWCVSSDASRNWSSYVSMNAGGGHWSSSFVEPGTGQTLYYQIATQDVVGNNGVYNGSMNISGPAGNDGPLMPPIALTLLAFLFFGLGNWLLNRRASNLETVAK